MHACGQNEKRRIIANRLKTRRVACAIVIQECRIPCAKGWSELQENIRGRGGSQWIIRTGHVGAGALTRPAMRSIARRWRARLASPDEGVRAYVSRGGWAQ